jgi:hypothetical protein
VCWLFICLSDAHLAAVKKLAVETCDNDKPDTFEKVFDVGRCPVVHFGRNLLDLFNC